MKYVSEYSPPHSLRLGTRNISFIIAVVKPFINHLIVIVKRWSNSLRRQSAVTVCIGIVPTSYNNCWHQSLNMIHFAEYISLQPRNSEMFSEIISYTDSEGWIVTSLYYSYFRAVWHIIEYELPKPITRRNCVKLIKLPHRVADTNDCCSLEFTNVIRLATITKVQVFNRGSDTSFNGGVCRFRSIVRGVKCL